MATAKSVKEKDVTPIYSNQLGVWRVLMQQDPYFGIKKQWDNFLTTIPLIWRLSVDIYNLGPGLFIFAILAKVWSGVESALLLYLSSRLLTIVSYTS